DPGSGGGCRRRPHPATLARGDRGGHGHQTAVRLRSAAGGHLRTAGLTAAVRVDADSGQGRIDGQAALPARRPGMSRPPGKAGPGAGPASAVLFDIDHTLVDTQRAFAAAIEAVAREDLPHVPAEEYHDLLKIWQADAQGYYRRFTRGEITHSEQRRARAKELHEAAGGPSLDDEDLFARWDARYAEAFANSWTPF